MVYLHGFWLICFIMVDVHKYYTINRSYGYDFYICLLVLATPFTKLFIQICAIIFISAIVLVGRLPLFVSAPLCLLEQKRLSFLGQYIYGQSTYPPPNVPPVEIRPY